MTTGVATMSLLTQGPVGSASGGSVGVCFFLRFFFAGSVVVLSVGEIDVVAPAVVAWSPLGSDPSLEPPRTRANPATSASARPSSTRRRVQ